MISHPHRCIFVHIPKTGGTSIENMIWPTKDQRSPENLWGGLIDGFRNKYQTGALQHLMARQILTEVGPETFQAYFKFAIVRNPWDRLISQFTYLTTRPDLCQYLGMNSGDSLRTYLQLIATKKHVQWKQQVAFVSDGEGRSLVDYIGRFEEFEASVRQIMDRIGLPITTIPHEKQSQRGPYQDYYDSETRDMVAMMYAADIEAFGYSFEDSPSPRPVESDSVEA